MGSGLNTPLAPNAAPADKLAFVVDTMRELSRQADAERMIGVYRQRMGKVMPTDRLVTISRREMPVPWYRITRSSHWTTPIDAWKHVDRQPRFDRGLLGELIYGDQPVILDEIALSPDEPAAEYFEGQRSLMAIPLYDDGVGLNMVIAMRREPAGFSRERLPEQVWMSNLFGQVTQNLVLSANVKEAYAAVDRELQAVAAIQQSLLPVTLPKISTLRLAAHYQTSRRAGGDYYDFFQLPDDNWGILIADVSGHGTPAAVLMAITHSIAHLVCDPPAPPARLLSAINERLCRLYTTDGGQFVTACYAVYDPASRELTYASAGHPQARVRRADGMVESLEGGRALPLGILAEGRYREARVTLRPGDALVLYTDGITEARSSDGELFDTSRLDAAVSRNGNAPDAILGSVLSAVDAFTKGRPASDDRTLLIGTVEA